MSLVVTEEEIDAALTLLRLRGWTRTRTRTAISESGKLDVQIVLAKSIDGIEYTIEFKRELPPWWDVSWRSPLGVKQPARVSLSSFLESVFRLEDGDE